MQLKRACRPARCPSCRNVGQGGHTEQLRDRKGTEKAAAAAQRPPTASKGKPSPLMGVAPSCLLFQEKVQGQKGAAGGRAPPLTLLQRPSLGATVAEHPRLQGRQSRQDDGRPCPGWGARPAPTPGPSESSRFHRVLAREGSLYRLTTEGSRGRSRQRGGRPLQVPQPRSWEGETGTTGAPHFPRPGPAAPPKRPSGSSDPAPSHRVSAPASSSAAWESAGSSSAQASSLLSLMTHELVSKYFLYSWQNLKPNFPSLLQMKA